LPFYIQSKIDEKNPQVLKIYDAMNIAALKRLQTLLGIAGMNNNNQIIDIQRFRVLP
jgi:hypothetical protein